MLRDNFCTFILTHGRAGNVITYKTLKAEGYTGPLFLVVDNEDVNTYTVLGQRGNLLFSFRNFSITQKTTQKNKGGMTEQYLDAGTYVKSFYSVMMSPSCVKIAGLNSTHARIHHQVSWENCVPKILNEKWKK